MVAPEKEKTKVTDFKDIVKSTPAGGEVIKFSELINHTFIIKEFFFLQSRFNPGKQYAWITVEKDGKTYVTNTGSEVIMKQLKLIENALPVRVTLRKVKRYYTFE